MKFGSRRSEGSRPKGAARQHPLRDSVERHARLYVTARLMLDNTVIRRRDLSYPFGLPAQHKSFK